MSSAIELGRAASAALTVLTLAAACSSCSSDDGTTTMDASLESGAGGSGATGSGGAGSATGGTVGTGGSGVAGSAGGTGGSLGSGGSGSGRGGAAGSSAQDASFANDGSAGSGGTPVSDASDVRGAFDVPPNCLAGDPTQPMQIRVGYRSDAGFTALGAAPAPVALAQAPQGGQVLFVGVEVRNVAGCTATIGTSLTDSQTQSVVSLESRPIFLDLASDGWLAPLQPTALSNYSNLPACPRASLTRSVDANTYQLRVSFTDASGRVAETTMNVVPTCPAGAANALCHCQCAVGYMLGMPCP